MTFDEFKSKVLLAALCLLAAAPVNAQDAGAAILGASPSAGAQCSGPLGSLLPECQTGKNPITINTDNRLSGAPAGLTRSEVRKPEASPEPQSPPVFLPAEPASEFQRFVASSIGRMLPVFGANLFQGVPTTFAPLDRVPVTSDYTVGPGDEIVLRVWGQVNLDTALTVDRAGDVFVPQAGTIAVAGLRYQQLPGFFRVKLERVFRNFDLTVNMGQLRSVQIFVVGQARRPGAYTVSSLSTLVNALFASGGPSAGGSMRRIQLKRGTQVVTELDLYDLHLRGDKSKDARLQPGDVVYIPTAGPQIAIAGSIKNPGIYEVNGEKTIGELIQTAGGLSVVADQHRATLERIREGNTRESLTLTLDGIGLQRPVMDGDLLHVLAITPQFENAVTLRGNVANAGRFPWHPGMRLRDVIPDKESLITRDYWTKRNLLGYAPQNASMPAEPLAEAQRKLSPTTIDTGVPDINWSYAVIERQNPRDLSTELVAFQPGRLILENDDAQNLELRRGDVITIFSQADFKVATFQQRRLVRLEGEFASAGVYAVRPGETLGQLISRAGGLTAQAYLFGAEFLRESTREDQQRRLNQIAQEMEQEIERTASNRLTRVSTPEEAAMLSGQIQSERTLVSRMRALKPTGRVVLNLSPAESDIARLMDLPLEDADRFVVPSRPATINVMGAVYNPNAFVYRPELRINDYIQLAGAATRGADKGRIFVIRADGSVVPRQGSSPFTRSFESNRLNPGDTIVVPEEMFKSGFVKGLKDWAQIIGQFGLGAAAVNVLR